MTDCAPVSILVVDDRPENLMALEAALAPLDYRVVKASSGEEALRCLLREEFVVVILDVAMPGLDGFQTAELIRGRDKMRKIPIIFVSAMQQQVEHVFRGYEAGAVDYLLKPIDVHALRAKVAVFADLFRQARALERAERQRREFLESLYDVTFEEAPIGIGHASVDGRWLRINRRLAEIVGYRQEEAQAHALGERIHPEDRPHLAAAIESVVTGVQARHRGEYRFLRDPDGNVIWVVLTISLMRDRVGKPVQLTIMEDVTDKKRIAESLEASELRFARLAESGLIGVAFETVDGTVVEANEAFLRMLRCPRQVLEQGRLRLTERCPPELADVDARAREELARSGSCRPYEKDLVRMDGVRVAVLVGASSWPEPAGAVWFALDMTERARALRELRESLKSRDDFLSAVAHELRTPLTPIQLQVQDLLARARSGERQPIDPQRLVQELEPVERAVARMAGLLDRLIVVSRITVGALPLEREEVDLSAIIGAVVERLRYEIERARCRLSVRTTRVLGSWDRVQLEQVLRELLSNALRFGRGKPIEIETGGNEELGWFSVRDYGTGIPPADQQRLFHRFERLSPLRNYGGLGVGLWLAQQIVAAHGGTIAAWSSTGEGTRFRVELPRGPARRDRHEP
jgi:PAS domain S-box-containing protein